MGPARGGMGMGGLLGLLPLLARFGWKGIVIGLLLVGALVYGGGLCTGIGTEPSRGASSQRTDPAEDELVRFVGFVFDDVQRSWQESLPRYRPAKMVVFSGAVESACGTTSSAVGPFYCPLDHQVYIDLSFYRELARRFGAPGDFAQAYVIAHEVGHHLQNQSGRLGGGGSRDSIAVELQADCLAGVWARSAESRGLLEIGDVEEALGAASAIGDDKIQMQTQGHIVPESFTHGSSEQRVGAFRRGMRGTTAEACNL